MGSSQMHSSLKKIVGDEIYRDWLLSGIDNQDEIKMMKLILKVNDLPYSIRSTLIHCCLFTMMLKNYVDTVDTEVEESRSISLLKQSSMYWKSRQPGSISVKKKEEGRFGLIYSGKIDGRRVVLKTLRDHQNCDYGDLSHEALIGGILNSIESDYYIRTYGYAEWPDIPIGKEGIITELSKSTDRIPYLILENVRRSKELGTFIYRRVKKRDSDSIYEVLIMICDALIEGFEKLSFTHGDIHQSNVLVVRHRHREARRLYTGGTLNTRWSIKIIDLGSARIDKIHEGGTSIIPTNILVSRTIPHPSHDIFRLLRITLIILTGSEQLMHSTIVHLFDAISSMFNNSYSQSESIRQTILTVDDDIELICRVLTDGFIEGAQELDMVMNITGDLNCKNALRYLKHITTSCHD